jgi:hypothetical protein
VSESAFAPLHRDGKADYQSDDVAEIVAFGEDNIARTAIVRMKDGSFYYASAAQGCQWTDWRACATLADALGHCSADDRKRLPLVTQWDALIDDGYRGIGLPRP